MLPPIVDPLSTRVTGSPESAMSSAAWMPATPPPITSTRLVTGTAVEYRGTWRRTRATPFRTRSIALSVAVSISEWIHEQCSRILTISIM